MNNPETKHIAGIPVEIEYKDVKHLHLSVHPPDGDVRAVVPTATKADKVHLFVVSRLGWIRRKKREMAKQPRKPPQQYTEGESVFLWGKQYRIRLKRTAGRHTVSLSGDWLEMSIRDGTDRAGRQRVIHKFYRKELTNEIPRLSKEWEAKTGLRADEYRIKMMYTKWGSCNVDARRIWLNLELAKHSKACLSYILLHELLHFEERSHTARFQALMTQHLPAWRNLRETLNNGFPGLPDLYSQGSIVRK
ncbi:M48 family metallopeptidase [Neolewinella aurantiaca]|nr:SprT family zinc-dependent metalloprotease [Neolewinella aurantiaca]